MRPWGYSTVLVNTHKQGLPPYEPTHATGPFQGPAPLSFDSFFLAPSLASPCVSDGIQIIHHDESEQESESL